MNEWLLRVKAVPIARFWSSGHFPHIMQYWQILTQRHFVVLISISVAKGAVRNLRISAMWRYGFEYPVSAHHSAKAKTLSNNSLWLEWQVATHLLYWCAKRKFWSILADS
jgi:hypothetical protein